MSLVELVGDGTDRVEARTSMALAENLEDLTLLGAGDIGGTGNALVNVIHGNAGGNILAGRGGNDTINGGAGSNVLAGGKGNDWLEGDDGDDIFVFRRLGDTGTPVRSSDTIADFEPGRDTIGLSRIDAIATNAVPDNAFTFFGSATFSNVAGQLRASTSGGVTTLAMDVTGDGVADAMIRLTNGVTVTAQELVL